MMAAGSLVAQTVAPAQNLNGFVDPTPVQLPTMNMSQERHKATESGWLSPSSLWSSYGASWQSGSLYRLFPDTNVVYIPNDGSAPFNHSWGLVGSVFQPDEPLYTAQVDNMWQMNREDEYTVDSIAFFYAYFRVEDSIMVDGFNVNIVDTVIIHFYQADNLASYSMRDNDNQFAIPIPNQYSVEKLGPNTVAFTDTLLLSKDAATDSVYPEGTFTGGTIAIPIPASIGQTPDHPNFDIANVVGTSVSYRPMQPFSVGDTLASFDPNVKQTNRLNNFGLIGYINTSGIGIEQFDYYNNSFVTNGQVRYGETINGLRGYLPSVNFFGWRKRLFLQLLLQSDRRES